MTWSLSVTFYSISAADLSPGRVSRPSTKEKKYDLIKEKKTNTSIEDLRGFPNEFATYLSYTRSLCFDEKPDYTYLRQIFRNLFAREGFRYDYVFAWTVYKYQKNPQALARVNS